MIESYEVALKNIRAIFGLSEMQVIVTATLGANLANVPLGDVLRENLEDSSSGLRSDVRPKGMNEKYRFLMDKVDNLDLAVAVVLQKQVLAIHREFPLSELFPEGRSLMPDPSLLRLKGLVAPAGQPATGYCVVILKDHFSWEQPLRHDPGTLESPDKFSVEQNAEQLVALVKLVKDDITSDDKRHVYYLCHQIIQKTGSRFVRVLEGDGLPTISEINPSVLRRDIANGSLQGLTMVGVNAPLPQHC